jgi:hypothetical protein
MTNARHRLVGPHALHFKSSARQSDSGHFRPTYCGPHAVAHVQGADSLVPARGCRFPRVQAHGTIGPHHVGPQHVGGVRGSKENYRKGGYHNENRSCSTRTPEVNTCLNTRTDRRTENYYHGRRLSREEAHQTKRARGTLRHANPSRPGPH